MKVNTSDFYVGDQLTVILAGINECRDGGQVNLTFLQYLFIFNGVNVYFDESISKIGNFEKDIFDKALHQLASRGNDIDSTVKQQTKLNVKHSKKYEKLHHFIKSLFVYKNAGSTDVMVRNGTSDEVIEKELFWINQQCINEIKDTKLCVVDIDFKLDVEKEKYKGKVETNTYLPAVVILNNLHTHYYHFVNVICDKSESYGRSYSLFCDDIQPGKSQFAVYQYSFDLKDFEAV